MTEHCLAYADAGRVDELFDEQYRQVLRRTDRLFAWLLVAQWLAAIATAVWISPLTWAGLDHETHPHLFAAVFLGGAVISLPVLLALIRPGATATRQAVAVGQALMSTLLIHLTGGRIETHFHVFCSLALLAFYRDWRVLLTASVVVAADHFVRGLVWPQSVYGTSLVSPWRFAEHAGWVLVEDVFLIFACRQGLREMRSVAERQAGLEQTNQMVLSANAQLREEIDHRRKTQEELERAKLTAEAANHAKTEFVANMSHELRTPLNAIIGFSDLLTEGACGPLPEIQGEYVKDILDSGQHLLSLVNDILDLAKIESGTSDLELGPVDVEEVIDRAVQFFRERAMRLGIALRSEVGPGLESVEADERRLKQLLYNLLSNALKFTAAGGEVVVRGHRENERVVIAVTDTGVGIPTDEQDKIFESFYQVDATLTKSRQGTGLGLALVRKIADLHRGCVWVQSKPGLGSTFFFSWPGWGDAIVAADDDSLQEPASLGGALS
jgi:signal transduction histidine kinase